MFIFQELLETLKFQNYICYEFMIKIYGYNHELTLEYYENRKIYLKKLNSLGKTKYNYITVLFKITHTIITHKLSKLFFCIQGNLIRSDFT